MLQVVKFIIYSLYTLSLNLIINNNFYYLFQYYTQNLHMYRIKFVLSSSCYHYELAIGKKGYNFVGNQPEVILILGITLKMQCQ